MLELCLWLNLSTDYFGAPLDKGVKKGLFLHSLLKLTVALCTVALHIFFSIITFDNSKMNYWNICQLCNWQMWVHYIKAQLFFALLIYKFENYLFHLTTFIFTIAIVRYCLCFCIWQLLCASLQIWTSVFTSLNNFCINYCMLQKQPQHYQHDW